MRPSKNLGVAGPRINRCTVAVSAHPAADMFNKNQTNRLAKDGSLITAHVRDAANALADHLSYFLEKSLSEGKPPDSLEKSRTMRRASSSEGNFAMSAPALVSCA